MLSDRLELIAAMTPECDVVADIGTDHGYLPIALVQMGKVTKAYAMDINQGPLDKARLNINKAGVGEAVQTILSNGLDFLPSDTSTVVIAGMGGMLIAKILESGQSKLDKVSNLILSPHLDEAELRKMVHQLGWLISQEKMVEDKGKFYTVLQCHKGNQVYTDLGYCYGQALIDSKDEVWVTYQKHRLKKLSMIKLGLANQGSMNSNARLEEINKEIKEIKAVIGYES